MESETKLSLTFALFAKKKTFMFIITFMVGMVMMVLVMIVMVMMIKVLV